MLVDWLPGILMLVLFMLETPIAFAIAISALAFFLLDGGIPLKIFAQKMVSATDSYPLLSIPFFVLAGAIMNKAGITSRLLALADAMVGHMTGALAQMCTLLATMLGGLTASSSADAAMLSKVLGPQMVRTGYSPAFAAVITSSAAIITSLLPSSVSIGRTDNVDRLNPSTATIDWWSQRSDRVMVQRSGDGFASAVFTVTFLGVGAKEMLRVSSSAGLQTRTYTSLSPPTQAFTSTGVSVAVGRLMPGGVDLTPLPGRYLSAATNTTLLSVRLRSQTTAACAATNWEAQYLGCYTSANLPTQVINFNYTLRREGGVSPQRCHLACQASSAVAFSLYGDVCSCYSSVPSANAIAGVNCHAPCSGDESFLCGSPENQTYSAYRMPVQAATSSDCQREGARFGPTTSIELPASMGARNR
jgi:hypothetical protein